MFEGTGIGAMREPLSPGPATSVKRERPPFLLFVPTTEDLPFANELIKALREEEAILNPLDTGDEGRTIRKP